MVNQETANQHDRPVDSPTPPPATNNDTNVSKVQIKIPAFWHESPEIWFAQIEAQFRVTGTLSDILRFNTVVGAIESKILAQVTNAVLTPPADGKYENLKQQILSRFADTEHSKMSKILSDMELGDKKPSHLLNEMRRLGGNIKEEFLETLWLQNLPAQARAILSASTGDLTALASLADKILEVSDDNQVNNVNNTNQSSNTQNRDVITSLERKIEALTRAIQSLRVDSARPSRPQSRSVSRPQQRSATPAVSSPKKVHDICWYHYRFGNDATKCTKPCNFSSKN